jgi:hypothetical protein
VSWGGDLNKRGIDRHPAQGPFAGVLEGVFEGAPSRARIEVEAEDVAHAAAHVLARDVVDSDLGAALRLHVDVQVDATQRLVALPRFLKLRRLVAQRVEAMWIV